MPIVRRGRKPVAEDAEPTPARREFVPFSNFAAHSGVFVTGEDPFWLVASDHGPVRLFDHGEKGVYSFSPIFFNAGDAQYVVQSKAVRALPERREAGQLTLGFAGHLGRISAERDVLGSRTAVRANSS